MEIKKRLEEDLKQSMKQKDEDRKRVLRLALSAIKLAEIENRHALDDSQITQLLQKEIKSRMETIGEAEKIARNDLVAVNQLEVEILKEYLPKQMNLSELESLCKQVISEIGAKSMVDMGKVMKVLLSKVQGRAPNEVVSATVKRLLE